MTINKTLAVELLAGVLIIGAAYYFSQRALGTAGGLFTGDNDLTRNATDADGKAVTAYQGAGVVGTLGAATNAVSGGYLASFGSWLGITVYDLTHDDPLLNTTSSVYGSTGLSAAAAQDARNVFAANDPRRVDMPRQPEKSWKLWES